MCVTVQSQCLEYLVYITLPWIKLLKNIVLCLITSECSKCTLHQAHYILYYQFCAFLSSTDNGYTKAKFFVAQIQIPILNKHLGCVFCVNTWTHCTKMDADGSAENTPNAPEFICPICLHKPKSSGF